MATNHTDDGTSQALQFFESVVDVIRSRCLFGATSSWGEAVQRATENVAAAETTSDTYPAIRRLLADLGDQHSFLITPEQARAWSGSESTDGPEPKVELTDDRIGRITLGPFGSGNPDLCVRFATDLQAAIQRVDDLEPIGWILDLRLNSGGNMWPMLAGLGPILGDGVHGSFDIVGEPRVEWGYIDGTATIGGEVAVSIKRPAYQVRSFPRIAVAIGPSTGSSGEAIAVAFRGAPGVRFFGQRTAGLSTCNDDARLSDGSILFLSTGVFVDRTGRRYVDGLSPDEVCDGEYLDSIDSASSWILDSRAFSRDA